MDILENPAPCRFDAEKVRDTIQKIAKEVGFDLVGIVNIAVSDEQLAISNKLDEWVKNDYCADMKWFRDSVEKRKDILKVMPDAKSVICVAMNYYDGKNKKDIKNQNSQFLAIARNCEFSEKPKIVGKIARYARGRPARTAGIVQSGGDYHKIFDKKLKLFVKMLKEEILFRQLADQNDKQNDKNWIPASAGMTQSMTGMTEEKLGIIEERAGMTNAKFKYYCDTGPVLERAWAVQAGLGFIGKNTNLITKYGSWVLLGEIITNLDVKNPKHEIRNTKQINMQCHPRGCGDPETNLDSRFHGNDKDSFEFTGTCGSCRRCLDACPTGALVALPTGQAGGRHGPYTVDARKCISYLTIEHKGEIPTELREKMGNRIFGCDACQEVCPFNVGRQIEGINFKTEVKLEKINATELDLKEILSIKIDEEFLNKFAGSPLMRAKRWGLVRNACIAAGNSGDGSLLPYLEECLKDNNAIIGEAARWAIEKLKKEI